MALDAALTTRSMRTRIAPRDLVARHTDRDLTTRVTKSSWTLTRGDTWQRGEGPEK